MRSLTPIMSLAALATFGGTALAQSWFQPWTPPRTSHESRVKSCAVPTPISRVAMDDWLQPANRVITSMIFNGNLFNVAQAFRQYYVAIYKNNPITCRPIMPPIYRACVVPFAAPAIGVDCLGRTVYRIYANMPGFPAFGGHRYWLQISEADNASIRVGMEDFRWSGRRPQLLCRALVG